MPHVAAILSLPPMGVIGKPAAVTCQPRSPGVGFAADNVPSFVGLSRLSCHLTSPFQFVSVLNLLLTRRRRLEFLPPSVDVRPGRSNVFGKSDFLWPCNAKAKCHCIVICSREKEYWTAVERADLTSPCVSQNMKDERIYLACIVICSLRDIGKC